ncbi:MAG: glycosyltransferase family 4 protein [Coriobacteriia bacterium]
MAVIGIDVSALSTSASGGIGVSQYATMRALAALEMPHRLFMYAATQPLVPFTDRPLDVRFPLRLGSGPLIRSSIAWMQTGVNRLLREDRVELFWSPRHLLPLHAPHNVALVATIQDFWHLHHPEHQPLLNRTVNAGLIRRITRRADHIVTTSFAVAEDAFTHYGVSRERLTVVPLGVDADVFHPMEAGLVAGRLSRLGVQRPFLLGLDVHNPRKNFARVLDAFAALPAGLRGNLRVVGVGRPRATAEDANPAAVAHRLGIESHVTLLDDVSLDDLVALYSGAEAFVYPSIYEGFGMPVLEAMACGCPVIASNRSSIPEVAGRAAVLVDPESAEDLGRVIGAVLAGDERERLARAGLARAEEMSWRRTAEGLLAVFERVLHERGGA